jgi:hypothetical protein
VNHVSPPIALLPAAGQWKQFTVPGINPGDSASLQRVAAISDTDVWAVGGTGPFKPGPSEQNLAVHWDGRRWQRVDVPGGAGLTAVTAIAAADVWAVGAGKNGAGGFTAHWNGHSWTEAASPRPAGTAPSGAISLWSVSAAGADDVWAVGCDSTEQGAPIIQHWNGHTWASSPLPSIPGEAVSCMTGVSVVSADDVWAVGRATQNQSQQPQPLALHWNGQQWSVVQTAGPFGNAHVGGFDNVIALSSTDVWAFGGYIEFAQHWDGRQWTHVPGPSDSDFEATADSPDGHGGLVTSTMITPPRTTLNVFSFDGQTWSNHPGPPLPAGTASGQLSGFGAAPGSRELWAVGSYSSGRSPAQHPLISLTLR